jgi:hypothetical protein
MKDGLREPVRRSRGFVHERSEWSVAAIPASPPVQRY